MHLRAEEAMIRTAGLPALTFPSTTLSSQRCSLHEPPNAALTVFPNVWTSEWCGTSRMQSCRRDSNSSDESWRPVADSRRRRASEERSSDFSSASSLLFLFLFFPISDFASLFLFFSDAIPTSLSSFLSLSTFLKYGKGLPNKPYH